MKKTKFDYRSFLKSVAAIAIPVALQNLLTTTGSMVDTMMIAPLGELTVGAVGLCAQFSSLMFSCYWGFVGGGMLFFAQYWGAKDEDGIDRAYETTLLFMMSVAAIFFCLGFFCPGLIMRFYTDKPDIQNVGIPYLRIAAFAYPLQIFSMAMCALLRSTDRVRVPLFGGIASVLTNIVLNAVLINGLFGLPAMGVRGAALATVIASAVNVLVILLLARRIRYPYLFRFLRHPRLKSIWMKTYLFKCFPIICNELLLGIGFTVCNIVLGRQSEEAIAALAVFRTLEGFIISFFTGFSNAASVLIGNGIGAGETRLAYERAKRLILICGSCIAVACAVLFLVHSPILSAMRLSGEAHKIGTTFVGIYCVAAVIRMCNWTQTDIFRAGGDAAFGTILEISFMYAVVMPAVLLSGIFLHLPVWVVFLSCYLDEPIRFTLMLIHTFSGKWIKPVTAAGVEGAKAFFKERGEVSKKTKAKAEKHPEA